MTSLLPIETSEQPAALRCIELFAGCGGLALGLHRAGWEGVFAVERDPMAFETLAKNMIEVGAPFLGFPHWPEWIAKTNLDLVQVLKDPVTRAHLSAFSGTIDLVAGGPPCQGFSVGGKRDGADERNSLVYRMLEFIELVRPRAVLIENVEGIGRRFVSKPGQAASSVADDAINELSKLGYVSSYHVVTASDFGVPQSRRRVVIIGLLKPGVSKADQKLLVETALKSAARETRTRHDLPTDRDITVWDAIHDLAGETEIICPDSPKFMAGTYSPAKSAYARLMRSGLSANATPDSHRFSKHGPGIKKLYDLAHASQPPGRLAKSFLLANGTKKDKKVLLDPKAVASTITTHPDEFIHFDHARNITVREMARLQSFPDKFRFHGRYTINGPRRRFDVARCSQVGNAVPPLMAEGLGLAVRELLEAMEAISILKDDHAEAPVVLSLHE